MGTESLRMEKISFSPDRKLKRPLVVRTPAILFSLILLSSLIKIFLASLGQGFDVGAWYQVSLIVRETGSVYGRYEFYNYGPIWGWLLGAVGYCSDWLPLSHSPENFHMWVALFLSLVDALMALVLRWAGFVRAALLFLANPVTWLVSGFVAQFDQLPVLIGLLAIICLSRGALGGKKAPFFLSGFILLIALSLATKHALIFFPAWAAFWWFSRFGLDRRYLLAITFLPVGFFLLFFLPYWFDPMAREGIVENVFRYQSNHLHSLIPQALAQVGILGPVEARFSFLPLFSGYRFLWVAAILWIGWLCRRRSALDIYIIYLVSFVALSPAIYGQYLVIPILACVVYWRFWEARLYTAAATLYLLYYSLRKMPFLRESSFVQETGFIPFLDRHYDALPKYFPLVFLLPLLWRIFRASAGTQPDRSAKEPAL